MCSLGHKTAQCHSIGQKTAAFLQLKSPHAAVVRMGPLGSAVRMDGECCIAYLVLSSDGLQEAEVVTAVEFEEVFFLSGNGRENLQGAQVA